MTSDSDDVAESADQKPPGSLTPQGPKEAPAKAGQPAREEAAERDPGESPAGAGG